MKTKIKEDLKKQSNGVDSVGIENKCLREIDQVLKKHNCSLQVGFFKDAVLGQSILKYQIQVLYNK